MKIFRESTKLIVTGIWAMFIVTALNAQKTRMSNNIARITDPSHCYQFNDSRFGEFLIDPNIIITPLGGDDPHITFDGTNFFLIWCENRMGFQSQIWGARVNRNGVPLDTGGIPISTTDGNKQFTGVSFDGTNYFVVWYDIRNGNGDIYGTRVTTGGIVLDPQGIPISTPSTGQIDPAVCFDGSNFLVIWSDARLGTWDIYGARVTQSGTVLDPQGFPISTAPDMQGDAKLAFDGLNYLVVWYDTRNSSTSDADIYGARVSPAGIVLDTLGVPICTARNLQGAPRLAFDGTNYLVIWYDSREVADICDVYGTRVTPEGVVLDITGIPIAKPGNNWDWTPAIAFDGTNYLAVWEDRSDSTWIEIYGKRVSPSGVVLDSMNIPICTGFETSYQPCLGFDGINYLAAWAGENLGDAWGGVYGKRISPSGIIQDSTYLLISNAANYQNNPTVDFDGVNYLVVWNDNRNDLYSDSSGWDLYGTRITPSGASLDSVGIPVAINIRHQMSPSLAFDGVNYLVAYSSEADYYHYDLYGVRVSPSGIVLDSIMIPIAVGAGWKENLNLAYGGPNFLCLWEDNRNGNWDIFGSRITPAGTVLDSSGLRICFNTNTQKYPAITFGDTNFYALWQDNRTGVYNIFGTRINTSGIVLDTDGIAITNLSRNQTKPVVAFDGVNYLAVWQGFRNDTCDICAARINQAGRLIDTSAIVVCGITGRQEAPTVTFDGTNYVIIWQNSPFGSYQCDLYGAKVSPAGIVIDSFIVSSQTGLQIQPNLIHGPADQVLVVYTGWTDSINHHSAKTMRIWGKLYPPYGIAEGQQFKVGSDRINIDLFPNPMNNTAYLHYNLIQDTHVKTSVYDVTGRLVKGIVNKKQKEGDYRMVLDLSDLSQGIYFLRSDFNSDTTIKKIILIK